MTALHALAGRKVAHTAVCASEQMCVSVCTIITKANFSGTSVGHSFSTSRQISISRRVGGKSAPSRARLNFASSRQTIAAVRLSELNPFPRVALSTKQTLILILIVGLYLILHRLQSSRDNDRICRTTDFCATVGRIIAQLAGATCKRPSSSIRLQHSVFP